MYIMSGGILMLVRRSKYEPTTVSCLPWNLLSAFVALAFALLYLLKKCKTIEANCCEISYEARKTLYLALVANYCNVLSFTVLLTSVEEWGKRTVLRKIKLWELSVKII